MVYLKSKVGAFYVCVLYGPQVWEHNIQYGFDVISLMTGCKKWSKLLNQQITWNPHFD